MLPQGIGSSCAETAEAGIGALGQLRGDKIVSVHRGERHKKVTADSDFGSDIPATRPWRTRSAMTDVVHRRLLFFVDVTPSGSVVARGLNNDIEIRSDNLADLRGALIDTLGASALTGASWA